MGEGTRGLLQVAPATTIEPVDDTGDVAPPPSTAPEDAGTPPKFELAAGRRRFIYASLIAIGLMAVPFIWISWVLWGPVNPLRPTVYENNFYELQARAMFHGHLYLHNGAIGIE